MIGGSEEQRPLSARARGWGLRGGRCGEPSILAHRLEEPVVWQGEHPDAIGSRLGASGEQGIENGFLGGLHRGLEERIQMPVASEPT